MPEELNLPDPALLSMSERKALFERYNSLPIPVARFGESVTPAMLQKYKPQEIASLAHSESAWTRKRTSSPSKQSSTAISTIPPMPVQTPNKQRNSFAPLCNSTLLAASNKQEQTEVEVGVNPNDIHSEYISLAWHNMASIKSARKLSRDCNRNAKQFYTLAYFDDEDPEEHARGINQISEVAEGDNTAESEDSVHNSRFAFDDDEAWLGSRKKSFIAEDRKEDELETKPSKAATAKKGNVIGLFLSQSQASTA